MCSVDALFLTLAGRGGSPGRPAAPGGPPGEAAERAEGGKGSSGGPFSFLGCRHQRIEGALQQGPRGSEGEGKTATAG